MATGQGHTGDLAHPGGRGRGDGDGVSGVFFGCKGDGELLTEMKNSFSFEEGGGRQLLLLFLVMISFGS